MSCIAGIINLDGRHIEQTILEEMINTLKGRGPDGNGLWCSQHIGLAHTLLQTDSSKPVEKQPCSLDGKIWIVADARIDGQWELRNTLKSHGRTLTASTSDAELILHAYAVFGDRLLDYVIGDFAFVIWDEEQSSVFCACDHFGIRPLYYVQKNNCFLFASEVTALLAHPAVSRKLNETAVGDFLLFGGHLEANMTIYSDIHRLPGATIVRIGASGRPALSQYWQIEEPEILPRMSTAEYVNEFKYILNQAVTDRLDANNIALEMSGGMDSTSIAAIAKAHAFQNTTLVAYTNSAFPLLPDDKEAYYAGQVASFLDIPIKYNNLSSTALFSRWGSPELVTAQPCPSENLAFSYDILKSVTDSGARIITSGFMADALFTVHGSYHRRLLQKANPVRFLHEMYAHIHTHKTWRGLGFRTFFNIKNSKNATLGPLPSWLNSNFVKRENLHDRWHRYWQLYARGGTLDQLRRPWLPHHFRGYEAFDLPLSSRYPFMDLRLIKFAMSAPTYIKHNKYVLRQAMDGQLPSEVLTRPKEGVPGDIRRLKIASGMNTRSPSALPILTQTDYIDPAAYSQAFDQFLTGDGAESTFWSSFILLPLALELWLSQNETQY